MGERVIARFLRYTRHAEGEIFFFFEVGDGATYLLHHAHDDL